ncbi:hypothetical protein SAMN05216412_11027 [Nitrosospira multiformis]|uniref:Uncharacterized protein n=1 Tax=Nitrosospira multiformis TaxID=1231 RepID=A0A1I0FRP3_9PROT|nr:hypothetical protein [Nitrosospira multiformis]SET61079.1 hypothetical protein SAMN05216412_11027 [Nitrosospira multiformis]
MAAKVKAVFKASDVQGLVNVYEETSGYYVTLGIPQQSFTKSDLGEVIAFLSGLKEQIEES